MLRPSIEIVGLCPYCEYRWTLDARDIRGQVSALTCFDCKTVFVVKVEVTVTSSVHALADVGVDELLAELGKPRRPAEKDPPAPPPEQRPGEQPAEPPRRTPPASEPFRAPRRSTPPERPTTSSLLTRNGTRTLNTREVRGSYGKGE